jgi:tetratricopeptide (TPR) repeat protein
MATLPRSLCLFLTIWMVGQRTAPTLPLESRDSRQWWNGPQFATLHQSARRLIAAGDWASAERLFRQGYEQARRAGARHAEMYWLESIAGCQMAEFEYRPALDTYLAAREIARRFGDRLEIGAISANLSSLYLQVWDLGAALAEAENAQEAARHLARVYYRPNLLLHLGRLHSVLRDGAAAGFFIDGIEAARAQGDTMQEARGWDWLGDLRLDEGSLEEAAQDYIESFRLRRLTHQGDVAFSYARLGALKLAEGDRGAARHFTRLALEAGAKVNSSFPPYLLEHQLGKVQWAGGEKDAALASFERALDLAANWRSGVLPAISSLTATDAGLEKRVFDSYIEAAADTALRTSNPVWARKSLEAVEWNRAASLRDSLDLAEGWRRRLPSRYWDTLGELRAEEARLWGGRREAGSRAEILRTRLTELEAEAVPLSSVNYAEKIRPQTSLNHFTNGLGESELLISFHLGEKESYLWAVTGRSVTLHRLAPAAAIRVEAAGFLEAVRSGSDQADELGARLYGELFGGLSRAETARTAWLLSLDDAMFDLPFAALVTGREGGKVRYLVEEHSLEQVPGALLLRRQAGGGQDRNGWFLGVADPIYNQADSRWPGGYAGGMWFAFRAAGPQLNRLVASGPEVDSSARSWNGPSTILAGSGARRESFLASVSNHPAIVHLATHVLTPADRPGQALIAFGLGSHENSEYLTTADVAMLHLPGAFVALTGCATGAGETQPGAGRLGLTRAWLMAGAGAVLSTAWSVPDSKGEILARFYSQLRLTSEAEALRRSQIATIRAGGWQASPAHWAAYQLTGVRAGGQQ